MAAIDISSAGGGGSVSTGVLQLQNGVAMDSTLRSVTDQNNTASTLKLSTTSVQVASTLQITTNSNPYIDAEDGSGNNRFQVGRDPSSQIVNIDFASNPTGGTNMVGGIRTYTDGVNLAQVMSFRKDGYIGAGTTSPTAKMHIVGENTSSSSYAVKVLNSVGQGILSVTNDGYTQIGDFSAQGYGSFLAFLRPSGGTRVTTFNQGNSNLTITNTNGNVTYQNTPITIIGSGSTSATTSLLVQNSGGTNTFKVQDDGAVLLGVTSTPRNDWALNVGGSLSLRALNSSADALGVYDNTTLTTYINGGGDIRTSGKIGVGSSALMTFQASAKLQIDSTTQGFLPPRMTDAQRAAISSPAEGLLVYNTDNHAVAYRDGTNWGYLCGALQNQTGSGGTLAISFASGNIVNLTLNASTTLTFAGHVVGTYIIQVTQGGAGSNTLTYPASVKWSGGTAPTLTTTVGKTDILTFYHDGTNFFGTYSLNY